MLGRQAPQRGLEDDDAFVLDRKQLLASDAHPAERELSAHTRFVGGLEQARAQGAMHLDESSDDLLGTVLESSDLPIFLFHTPPSTAVVAGCAAGRR